MFGRGAASRELSLRRSLRDPAMRVAILLFVVCLGAQGAYWSYSRSVMPEMGIVPDVPGERTVRALSFGDEETFFRLLALNLQNSGDMFGQFTALYKYDYNKLYHWFHLLDRLNNESNYLPAMATYYFSQTQNGADLHYIVDYVDEYTAGRVKEKWWWVVQAVYIANHKMKDEARAIKLANGLRGVRGIPIWAQQMPAFIHEKRGEFGDALAIMEDILAHPDEYSEGELNFMRYFIDERLGKLDAVKKELEAMQKYKAEHPDAAVPAQSPPPDVGAPKAPGF